MVAPGAGDLVEHGFCRMGIFSDVQNRKVAHDERIYQRRKRQQHQGKLAKRGDPAKLHQAHVAFIGAPERRAHLQAGEHKRGNEREMADLGGHDPVFPTASASSCFHLPDFFSASATSGGM